jgi:hypothetical protein
METALPRILSISFSVFSNKFSPFNFIKPPTVTPGGAGTSLNMDKPVVVFPAPVSPTKPRVLPFSISKSISFRA